AAVAVVLRTLGKRTTLIYLASIAGCALACGVLVDVFYTAFDLSAWAVAGEAAETIPSWLALACAIILLLMTGFSLGRKMVRRKTDAVRRSAGSQPAIGILPSPELIERPLKGPS
ncbi:MAG: hypothetical protein QNJ48_09345, partial [Desulfobacterales bacterium]|nr:hypothetical protein [Desulfobacterales bacterium]